jgi:regulator of CtrA degradation
MAAYGNSAMALTTYLMQMASQVLMLRSIRDGQMSLENAQAEYRKMQTVNRTDLNLEAGDKLPSRLKELMETSVGLRKRLSGFFTQLVEPVFVTSPNSVHEQMSLLATAFGR